MAAVGDEDENIRKFSCEKILMVRNANSSDTICCFDKKTNTVKFISDSSINMVDWENCDFDAPPHLQDITSKAVGSNEQVVLPHYPYHSQDVERNIKDVSAVCGRVTDMTHTTVLSFK